MRLVSPYWKKRWWALVQCHCESNWESQTFWGRSARSSQSSPCRGYYSLYRGGSSRSRNYRRGCNSRCRYLWTWIGWGFASWFVSCQGLLLGLMDFRWSPWITWLVTSWRLRALSLWVSLLALLVAVGTRSWSMFLRLGIIRLLGKRGRCGWWGLW